MKNNNKILRLNEDQFNALIEEAVVRVIEEGKWGNFSKQLGKKIGKGALYGALGAGSIGASIGAIGTGLDQHDAYNQELSTQAQEMRDTHGPSEEDVIEYLQYNKMEDTPQNREIAWERMTTNESKINNRLSEIIREEISKVL
jgi:hypothetical protein